MQSTCRNNAAADNKFGKTLDSSVQRKRRSRSLWKSVFRCFEEVREQEVEIKLVAANPRFNETKERIESWLKQSDPDIPETARDKAQDSCPTQRVQDDGDQKEVPYQSTQMIRRGLWENSVGKKSQDRCKSKNKRPVHQAPFTYKTEHASVRSPLIQAQPAIIETDKLLVTEYPDPKTSSLDTADQPESVDAQFWLSSLFNVGPFFCNEARTQRR